MSPPPKWIVPVPLHPRRLQQRGFNPAALIGRELAKETGARFEPRLLIRVRETTSQTGLGRAERLRAAVWTRCRGTYGTRLDLADKPQ